MARFRKYVGIVIILCTIGGLGFLLMKSRSSIVSPVPEEGAIRVIYLTPTPFMTPTTFPSQTPAPTAKS